MNTKRCIKTHMALTFYELVQHAVDVCGSFVRHDPAARHDLQAPLGQQLPHNAPLRRMGATMRQTVEFSFA